MNITSNNKPKKPEDITIHQDMLIEGVVLNDKMANILKKYFFWVESKKEINPFDLEERCMARITISFALHVLSPKFYPIGEWTHEPESPVQTEYKGYNLSCKRNLSYNWCGYITLHPDDDAKFIEENILIHGGITFSGKLLETDETIAIGIDTSHFGDASPLEAALNMQGVTTYRTLEYVINELKNGVDQIIDLKKKND